MRQYEFLTEGLLLDNPSHKLGPFCNRIQMQMHRVSCHAALLSEHSHALGLAPERLVGMLALAAEAMTSVSSDAMDSEGFLYFLLTASSVS